MNAADKIIAKKKKYIIPCSYHFYANPPALVKGEMQYLYDSDGKKYTDFFTGVTVMNCGHCNPDITGPVIEQIQTLQHTTTIYLTNPIVDAAEALVNFMDNSLKKVFFVNSGTEANEGALLLARLYTGKRGIIALNGGLHGRTDLTMNLTGIDMWRTVENKDEKAYFAPRPHCAQCSMGKSVNTCSYECVAVVEDLLEKYDIAALIMEPVQGNGGTIVPPESYMVKLKEALRKHGALLIFDEVQTGMGRTGKKYAYEHFGVEPDILTTAKALGNGFPIGAFCTTDEIAACYTKPGASTTGGNAMSAIAAVTVLNYHEKHRLWEKSAELGENLLSRLAAIGAKYDSIAEVRGKGLMIGMELLKDGEPLAKETDMILEAMKDRGFLIGKSGLERNVIAFLPPLIIGAADIDNMVVNLQEVMDAVL